MTGERIVLTRWNVPLAVTMLVITGMFWVFPVIELTGGGYRVGEQVVIGGFSALLAIPFLWVCWRVPKTLRGMGIEVDAEGIHPFDGKRTDTIPWHEIAAVGFGWYARTSRGARTMPVPALEVYLMDAGYTGGHRRLRGDWQDLAAPEPGLSAGCYRFTMSRFGTAAEQVERAVRRFRPTAWRGPFEHDHAR